MLKQFVEHFVDRGYVTAHIGDHPAAANVVLPALSVVLFDRGLDQGQAIKNKMDAANYIESMKSSNKEPDPQQIKDFYNSGGTNVYKMLFGDKK